MGGFASDTTRSEERGREIDRVIGEAFVDPRWREVERKLSSETALFGAPRFPYVGRHYDLSVDGEPFRLLVLGLDHYETVTVSREVHSAWILDTGSRPHRNHWRGTQNLVWAFLSDAEPPMGDETWHVPVGGRPTNWMECFAFSNLRARARVRAKLKGEKREPTSDSLGWIGDTWELGEEVLRKTLKILEPTHVVIQQKNDWVPYLKKITAADGGDGRNYLEFPHPSQRNGKSWVSWNAPFFQEEVLPAVRASRLI